MSDSIFIRSALVKSLREYADGLLEEDAAIDAWKENDDIIHAIVYSGQFGANQEKYESLASALTANAIPRNTSTPLQTLIPGFTESLRSATSRLSRVHDWPRSVLIPYAMLMLQGHLPPEAVTADLNSLADAAESMASYQELLRSARHEARNACHALSQLLGTEQDVQSQALATERAVLKSQLASTLITQCETLRSALASDSREWVKDTQAVYKAAKAQAMADLSKDTAIQVVLLMMGPKPSSHD